MTLFITGAKGFIGSKLVDALGKKGIEYIATDVIDDHADNYFKADITSAKIYDSIPKECDAIIHLAALSRHQDCKNNSLNCFNVNVQGTLNLMDIARKKNIKKFIFASTEWVYDSFKENEIKTEESLIDIQKIDSEYALSKIVSEVNLRQQYQNGFCDVSILRFGIIYGPRKENWSAVEALYHGVVKKDVIEVGSLRTGRCFIHIDDIIAGIIKSCDLKGFHLINLQGDRLVTLNEIIETSKKILNRSPRVVEKDPAIPSIRRISNEYAKKVLNWQPKISLEKGLRSLDQIL